VVFFLIATSILGVMYAYVGWRLLEPWQLSSGVKWAAWGVLGVHLAVVIASFALMRLTGSAAIARALWWVGFVGLGLLSLLFAGLLVRDLGWAGLGLVDWVLPGERRILPVDPDRRRFLLGAFNMALLGLTGAASAVGVWGAQHIPRVKEVVVPILGLPEALEGYRIVQITDLHVGPTIREDYVAGVVSAIAKLDADLIAVTGDMVDGSPEDLEPLMQPLAQLRARDGVFFCTGNHEYYSGVLRWCAAMSRLGMKVLNNAHAVVTRQGARILVAGVTDHRAHTMVPSHRSDPGAAVEGAPPCDVRLLLAHQPKSCHAAAEVGFDLQLSGHTHGGQIFPWTLLVRLAQPFGSGLHRLGQMWVYVSRGTGYWGPPMRLGAPSEITLLRLERAK
jgi:predicted MPP superfamily phosphohydrolase